MNDLRVLTILLRSYPTFPMHEISTTPFRTLITTLISQRARDEQIIPVAETLFSLADTAEDIHKLPISQLENILKPSGKYRQNANRIKMICSILLKKYNGKVPDTLQELLLLPGIGRKTANIVLSHSFGQDVIAVDTHVHRITNRLGWIKTKTPEQTEFELMKIIPKHYWSSLNRVFVRHGQLKCSPVSPHCSTCQIHVPCKRVGVRRSR